MKTVSAPGAIVPKILLPKPGVDLTRWAVIACDQFTSEPEYWQSVARIVGDAPSAFHLILPEAYLDTPEEAEHVRSIHAAMHDYLDRGLFVEHDGIVLVERTVAGKTRHGIMLALDLEQYDYNKGSKSLIRATEGTILERIPPRVRIRSGAPLELPHILVLIDDPACTVIEPLVEARHGLAPLYDTDLMLDSGHVTGYYVDDERLQSQALEALASLADPAGFAEKYGLEPGSPVLLFAMGDGNHSLATAKAIWEQVKAHALNTGTGLDMNHPARYALVEVENIHDTGLAFEPIFRVAFDVKGDVAQALEAFYPGHARVADCDNRAEMVALVDAQSGQGSEQVIGVVSQDGYCVAYVSDPPANLPVGTLQNFLDWWAARGGFGKVDYVHGEEVVVRLGTQGGNAGFYLPAIDKGEFFKTVIVDGALPRKTFSMGEAKEKRFYMEARRISQVSSGSVDAKSFSRAQN